MGPFELSAGNDSLVEHGRRGIERRVVCLLAHDLV